MRVSGSPARRADFQAIVSALAMQIAVATAWLSLPALAPQIALSGPLAFQVAQASGFLFAGALLPSLMAGGLIPRVGPLRVFQFGTVLAGIAVTITLLAPSGSYSAGLMPVGTAILFSSLLYVTSVRARRAAAGIL